MQLPQFRVPFLMERLAPPSTGLTGTFDSAYLSGITTFVEYITNKGGFAILDREFHRHRHAYNPLTLLSAHNFMIYNGAQITSTDNFKTFWTNLAAKFADNANVIFGKQHFYCILHATWLTCRRLDERAT